MRSFDNSVLVFVTIRLSCCYRCFKFKSSLFSEPCPDPGHPHQGNRTGDDFRHGKPVTFACPRDYVMEGVRTIKCSDGGAMKNQVAKVSFFVYRALLMVS